MLRKAKISSSVFLATKDMKGLLSGRIPGKMKLVEVLIV
jgi:hypothetical protein